MRISLALVAAVGLGYTVDARSCDDDLAVRTHGGVVHGMVDGATPAVRQFLGIPYGRPPPALPFGELKATEFGPSSMQYASIIPPNMLTHELLELNLGGLNGSAGPISEDCLTLSIWAPRGKTNKKLPVLIFFYGGAFTVGDTNAPYLLPAQWIERTKSHIVISFNHRDNIFGFPNAAGLPDDDPIANSVILDSGNEFIDILTRDPAHANFTFAASHLGCASLNPADELACMRAVDAQAIEDFIQTYSESGPATPPLYFSAVLNDGRTIFANYTALAHAGQIARLPALLGSNAHEGVSFTPYRPDGVDVELADQTTAFFFFCPTYQAARVRVAAHGGKVPVYRYLYSGNFTNVSPKPWMGAWHGSEMPLVFGTHPLYRGNSTELEYLTSYAMQDAWLAFVATGGRKMSIEGWDVWDEVDGGKVVEFGNGVPARLVDTAGMEGGCGL
ncbi:Alpha/Beta hydrolase protein [Chaetomidium leptoderma]|uniref:Alpha/Beta hydrolase protein n=1 Tax=Chaetomidium leptoderma TaxID=669021 RepID=A0AAN6VNP7_9PEZI|nr:Alpha/Beta hydrolase protein [Chaetomidium leptoderma]